MSMKIEVKQITPPELWREMAEMTTGKPCKMSWATALKNGHSLIRAKMWCVKMYDIPQCVMGHLVRHVHAQPYVLSKRPDRGAVDFGLVAKGLASGVMNEIDGKNWDEIPVLADMIADLPKRFGRQSPTSMGWIMNTEELINISHLRLCGKASKETREVVQTICELIEEQDPDLYKHLIPQCVYRGGICPESKCCGYIHSEKGRKRLSEYKELFTNRK